MRWRTLLIFLATVSAPIEVIVAFVHSGRPGSAARVEAAEQEAWRLRTVGHEHVLERLNAGMSASWPTSRSTSRPARDEFADRARFEERVGAATISMTPLESVAGDEQFVEMTIRVRSASGEVLAEQGERLGLERGQGQWRISRINVYGIED